MQCTTEFDKERLLYSILTNQPCGCCRSVNSCRIKTVDYNSRTVLGCRACGKSLKVEEIGENRALIAAWWVAPLRTYEQKTIAPIEKEEGK